MVRHKNIDIMKVGEFPPYDIIYTDPPWEQGLVKMFETIQFKQTGIERPNNSIDEILNHLAKLSHTDKPIWIDYSVKGHERVLHIMKSKGHTFNEKKILIQTNGKPYIVMSFNTNIKMTDSNGFDNIRDIVRKTKAEVVFDPFAGIGAIAKTVLGEGSDYVGYELNPARYKRLVSEIEKYHK